LFSSLSAFTLASSHSTTPSAGGTGTTMSLEGLSNEVLLLIIKSLPLEEVEVDELDSIPSHLCPNLQWVVNLSHTSRRLRMLVQEHLYATYSSRIGTPYLFLRTIMSNADAAESVRSMTIDYTHWQNMPYNDLLRTFEHIEGVKNKIRSSFEPSLSEREDTEGGMKILQIPDWRTWATRCNEESWNKDTLSAAILMHTPNIQHLDILHGHLPYDQPRWLDILWHAVGPKSLGRVHVLSKLKSIRISNCEMSLETLSPLFRLPSLTKLALLGLLGPYEVAPREPTIQWSVPTRSSSIEELSLYNCYVGISHLNTMMETCRSLTKIQYDHSDVGFGHNPSLDYRVVFQAIQPHRDSLRHLALQSSHMYGADPENNGIVGTLGSLKSFEKLEYLKCPIRALTHVPEPQTNVFEKLPSSLSTFVITVKDFDKEEILMQMCEHTAAQGRAHLALLEKFRLEMTWHTLTVRSPPSLQWGKVWKAFANIGVEFVIDEWMGLANNYRQSQFEDTWSRLENESWSSDSEDETWDIESLDD
jgi:hypothetical protein